MSRFGTECRTCELVRRRDDGEAPLWDRIVRTPSWDVVHCDGTSLEGWIVLALRRHAPALGDLTDAEADELGPLVRDVSQAVAAVTGCAKTYVAQFAEHPLHPHVHVHVIPRAADIDDAEKGPGIFARLGQPEEEWVPEARRDELALALREHLGAP